MPCKRAGGRVHGHVQDDDLARLVGFAGKFGGVGRVGHDRRGDRAGQAQHAAVAWQVLSQVIDDQAQVSLVRGGGMTGRRRVGGTGQAAEQTEDERKTHLNCRA